MRAAAFFVIVGLLGKVRADPADCDRLVSWNGVDKNSECVTLCELGSTPGHCRRQYCYNWVPVDLSEFVPRRPVGGANYCQDSCQFDSTCDYFFWDLDTADCWHLTQDELMVLFSDPPDEGGPADPVFGPKWCEDSPALPPTIPATATPPPFLTTALATPPPVFTTLPTPPEPVDCDKLVSWDRSDRNQDCSGSCSTEIFPDHCRVENCYISLVVDLSAYDTSGEAYAPRNCQNLCQYFAMPEYFFWHPLTEDCYLLSEADVLDLFSDPPAAGGPNDPVFGPKWCEDTPTLPPTVPATAPPVLTTVPATAPPVLTTVPATAPPVLTTALATLPPVFTTLPTPPEPVDCEKLVSWDRGSENKACEDACVGGSLPDHCRLEKCYTSAVVDISAYHPDLDVDTPEDCQDACQFYPSCNHFFFASGGCFFLEEAEYQHLFSDPPAEGGPNDPIFGPQWCEDLCHLGHLEAVYIQDLSWSHNARLGIVKAGLSAAALEVAGKYGSAKFGLASYSDKPVEPFGYPISLDYCYWLYMGLGDEVQFNAELGSTSTRSGNDWYEDPLDAMHQAAVDPRVGWTKTATAHDGRPVSQVMIVNSDGGIHYGGDGLTHGLVEHDGGDVLRCKTMDYPAVSTVAAAIGAAGNGSMKVVFIATEDNEPQYETLASQLEALGIPTLVIVPSSADEAGMEGAAVEALDVCTFPAVPPIRRLLAHPATEPHRAAQPAAVVAGDAFDPCAHE